METISNLKESNLRVRIPPACFRRPSLRTENRCTLSTCTKKNRMQVCLPISNQLFSLSSGCAVGQWTARLHKTENGLDMDENSNLRFRKKREK